MVPREITAIGGSSAEELAKIMLDENPEFSAWTKTLDPKHWARYDLSACRLGWEAARAAAKERQA